MTSYLMKMEEPVCSGSSLQAEPVPTHFHSTPFPDSHFILTLASSKMVFYQVSSPHLLLLLVGPSLIFYWPDRLASHYSQALLTSSLRPLPRQGQTPPLRLLMPCPRRGHAHPARPFTSSLSCTTACSSRR